MDYLHYNPVKHGYVTRVVDWPHSSFHRFVKLGSADLGQSIRLLAAIAYFQEKKLSLGKAAQLAGINRLAFMDVLSQGGIVIFDYDESMLASELKGIAQLSLNQHGRQ
jgi:predicted HTH domain antitoxin